MYFFSPQSSIALATSMDIQHGSQPASLDRGNPAFPLSLTLLLATFSLLSSSACLRL